MNSTRQHSLTAGSFNIFTNFLRFLTKLGVAKRELHTLEMSARFHVPGFSRIEFDMERE